MSEAERAFYEWWHVANLSGALIDLYRTGFLAGWEAAGAARNERPSDD